MAVTRQRDCLARRQRLRSGLKNQVFSGMEIMKTPDIDSYFKTTESSV